jgi:tetratricopeptide (TPR) repeat protein
MTFPTHPDVPTDIDFFISHATADDAFVSKLDAALNAAGITTWVDHEHGIEYGDRWMKAIQDATIRSKAALFILTPNAARSEWCERELHQIYSNLKRKIYVVIASPTPAWHIPMIVNNTQYKDLTKADLDKADDPLVRGLIDALQGRTSFTGTITETRRTQRITGAYPFNDLLYTLYGRESDLSKLTDWLTATTRTTPIAQLLGIGGVGKTRLTVEIVDTLNFRDGVIWFRFDKAYSDYENSPARVAELIRDHLALPSGTSESTAWSALNGRETLLVLDNGEDCPIPQRKAFAERIRALQDGPRVLITSRHAWDELIGIAHDECDLFAPSPDAAVNILKRMAEVNGYAAKLGEHAAQLAEKALYHPRLMLYAVGWLKANPPQAIIKALETFKGKEVEKALEEMVGRTLHQMTEQEGDAPLHALRRLNVTVGGFNREAAEALLAAMLEEDPMLSPLTTLAAWNMLDFDGNRYSIDPLIVRAAGIDESAIVSHYEHYKAIAKKHDSAQDYIGLEIESANLEAAFERATERDVAQAFWFASTCSDFLVNRMRVRQRMDWLKRVEPLIINSADTDLVGAFQNSMGNAYCNLAGVEDNAANLRRAIAAYTEALRFYSPHTAPLAYATTQNNLGNAYCNLAGVEDNAANLRRAIAAYTEALRFRTPHAAPLDYAMTQNNLGNAYWMLEGVEVNAANLRRAIAAYTEALRFYTPHAAPLNYAGTQLNIGLAYAGMAELDKACQAWAESERYYRVNGRVEMADRIAQHMQNVGCA